MRIIVNDVESENLYVVRHKQANFIWFDRCDQLNYEDKYWILKNIEEKYYKGSCSATVLILRSVATPKNWTIIRSQRYPQDSAEAHCYDCLQSVRHRTDQILQTDQRNWSPNHKPKTTFECRQCLWLWAGINNCIRYDMICYFNVRSKADISPLNLPLVAWHKGRTSVSDWRTFPFLCSTCSWWVTTNVGKPSATGEPTRPTQPVILSGSINE